VTPHNPHSRQYIAVANVHHAVTWQQKRGSGVLQVAEVCVQALLQGGARNKVLEIAASPSAPRRPIDQWFSDV
jgi:hypothetical protein